MISVIMPVTLQDYPGAAKNRRNKFIAAIDSFIDQFNVTGHELIIVSDGCKEAEQVYKQYYQKHPHIRFFLVEKQDLFSGYLRYFGILQSKNPWITYLDSDDSYGCFHLSGIVKGIKKHSSAHWLYWNEILDYPDQIGIKEVSVEVGSIGTSSIAHRRDVKASWQNCNGYGHDTKFIFQLDITKSVKIDGTAYHIRHIPGIFDA